MHKLLEEINRWTDSGPSGNNKYFLSPLALMGIQGAASLAGTLIGNRQGNIPDAITSQQINPYFDDKNITDV